MSKNYLNEDNLQIAMTEYKNLSVDKVVKTQYNDRVGTVSQVYDNEHGNGEQVYAVVDNPDQQPSEVEEVTVLFRGSAGPDKVLTEDFRNDWLENDLPLALRISAKNHPNYSQNYDHSSAQLKAASKALKTIMKTYPNAKVNLYGHSLGSMNAQYAMANLSKKALSRVNSAHIYNGPNIYSLLSDEQQEKVDAIKGKIYNYADPKDMISMVGRDISQGSEGAVGVVYYVDSQSKGFADQHMTLGYALDKEGKIKVLNTIETAALNKVYTGMETYQQLKASLSSGGLTGHEQVYLDYSQASVIAASLGTIAQEAYEQTKAIRDEAVA
ncbi:Mbeg1-like protein, partial [Streptococcus ferus]